MVGEFNAGKSSVINALLGGRFLREGVLPTTNEISVLRYGTVARTRPRTPPGCVGPGSETSPSRGLCFSRLVPSYEYYMEVQATATLCGGGRRIQRAAWAVAAPTSVRGRVSAHVALTRVSFLHFCPDVFYVRTCVYTI